MERIIVLIIIAIALIICFRKYTAKKEDNKMPQGLQVFDGNGNIVLDFTTKTMKVYGIVSTGTTAGHYDDARIDPNNIFIMPIKMDLETANGSPGHIRQYQYFAPRVTVSAGRLEWSILDKFTDRFGTHYPSYRINFTFIYGGFE